MTTYAKTTTVPSSKSIGEIEKILTRYGATGFMYGWRGDKAIIGFESNDRSVRISVPMPVQGNRDFTHANSGRARTEAEAKKAYEQAVRQVWRAVALIIKGKLQGIESGIVTFDEEFMPHIVMPNGQTMGETLLPKMNQALDTNSTPPMLPDYS